MNKSLKHTAAILFLSATVGGIFPVAHAQGVNPTGSPCDLLNSGGTVFDQRDCDQLTASGVIVVKETSGLTAYLLPGKSVKCQFHKKNKPDSAGINLTFIDTKTRSVLAKCKTGANGAFTVTIPSGFSGPAGIIVGPPNPSPTEPDGCFNFQLLPMDNNCLSIEEEVDLPLLCCHMCCPEVAIQLQHTTVPTSAITTTRSNIKKGIK